MPELGKVVLASNDPERDLERDRRGRPDRPRHLRRAQTDLPRSLVNPDYKNFAPRVGFAWTPCGSRKTVLRGGYGIFYTGFAVESDTANSLQNTFPYRADGNLHARG